MRSFAVTITLLSFLATGSIAQNNGITPVTCQPETVNCDSTADCEAKGKLGGFPCPAGSGQNDADCWIASSSDPSVPMTVQVHRSLQSLFMDASCKICLLTYLTQCWCCKASSKKMFRA
ncbi:hypothetical protein CLIM01_05072 [Colletotrichum limetticola]|uniref:Uncharacterized protein n=1 Tax=Colletotrichum limetticola TaxID=1209924 RepID=A0ABQ9Q1C5_9PEZI|nr:hypothetical protein CLIM01_05072 [Colletotrichum limetticola]